MVYIVGELPQPIFILPRRRDPNQLALPRENKEVGLPARCPLAAPKAPLPASRTLGAVASATAPEHHPGAFAERSANPPSSNPYPTHSAQFTIVANGWTTVHAREGSGMI